LNEREKFQDAIEQLYIVFARYPVRRNMPACSCCITSKEIIWLTTTPLQALTESDIGRYHFKAMTTWGDTEDFRHFLPRIFELINKFPNDLYFGLERICDKLQYAQWLTWPLQEQQAVLTALLAHWQLTLTDFDPHYDQMSIDYLHALEPMIEDISPFLTVWQDMESVATLRNMARFVLEQQYGPFQKQIINWLLQPAIRQRLEDYFFRYEQESFANELAQAIDILYYLQKAT
jgi:hypothetical protein